MREIRKKGYNDEQGDFFLNSSSASVFLGVTGLIKVYFICIPGYRALEACVKFLRILYVSVISASRPCIFDHDVCDYMLTCEWAAKHWLNRGVEGSKVDVSYATGRSASHLPCFPKDK